MPILSFKVLWTKSNKNNNNKELLIKDLNIKGFSFFRIKERGLKKAKISIITFERFNH